MDVKPTRGILIFLIALLVIAEGKKSSGTDHARRDWDWSFLDSYIEDLFDQGSDETGQEDEGPVTDSTTWVTDQSTQESESSYEETETGNGNGPPGTGTGTGSGGTGNNNGRPGTGTGRGGAVSVCETTSQSSEQSPTFITSNAQASTLSCGRSGQARLSRPSRSEKLIELLERIVGGNFADQNEYPFQVALIPSISGMPECGGTLVTDQWILTAAHCFVNPENKTWDRDLSHWEFIQGTNNPTMPGAVRLRAQRIVINPGYNKDDERTDDDIALVKLCAPIDGAPTICLPQYDPIPVFRGKLCTVIGWGRLAEGGGQPENLKEVDLTVHDPRNGCTDSEKTLCAQQANKDNCEGDSGGPLLCKIGNSRNYVQIGVVSFGTGVCAGAGTFSVYTNVYHYIKWIRDTTST